ncbi:hypothetical protein [Coleofasciculus sp. H7-2]|uniref:hypothetical protein n=1 Tax=Coleofasciculus sp. H7-2 TaxID=3351545 RepID=UPI00366C10CA
MQVQIWYPILLILSIPEASIPADPTPLVNPERLGMRYQTIGIQRDLILPAKWLKT